jgi:hypothetical protein
LDTFRDTKYTLLSVPIILIYGTVLAFFDQFLFFSPYFVFYVPASGLANLALDLTLTALTTLVMTVSIRQLILQRSGGRASRTGTIGVIAAILAGACPCYYLIPLLAVAGTVGGALGAVGILLNAFQLPIKLAAALLLVIAGYELNKSGVCRINPRGDVQKAENE